MFLLGLTGPTGAGKAVAAQELKKYGFAVIDADKTARVAVSVGSLCLKELADAYGTDIIDSDGTLDRKKLASRAFKDRQSTELLNKITHPYITAEIKKEIDQLNSEGNSLVVLDAPALFESGADRLCDKVITVTASEQMRLERIITRDSLSQEEALRRISAQPDSEYYTSRSDYVLINDTEPDDLKIKTKNLIPKLLDN